MELGLQLPGDELAPFETSLASWGRAQSSCWGQRVPDTALFPLHIQSHVPRGGHARESRNTREQPPGHVCFGLMLCREMGIACSFVQWRE